MSVQSTTTSPDEPRVAERFMRVVDRGGPALLYVTMIWMLQVVPHFAP